MPALATDWDKINLLKTLARWWPAGDIFAVVYCADVDYRLGKRFFPPCGTADCWRDRMKNIVPDYRLDMVGEPCPYPAVATLEAMPQLKKGEILEVVSDCAVDQ